MLQHNIIKRYMKSFLGQTLFVMSLILSNTSCTSEPKSDYPVVRIETGAGDIDIEVYTDKAPITSKHFLQMIENGVYKDAQFYRVLQSNPGGDYNTGVIQGGVYGKTVNAPMVEHEHTEVTGLSNTDGMVALARLEAGTASTEFFINVGDQSSLDFGRRGTADSLGMAVFGKVINGFTTVKRIHNEKVNGDKLVQPIKINTMKIISKGK